LHIVIWLKILPWVLADSTTIQHRTTKQMELVDGLLHPATTFSSTNYFWDDYISQVIWLWRWGFIYFSAWGL